MRLPGFRVRSLMVAVVVVALLTWGVLMGARSFDYARLAGIYGTYERQWGAMADRDRAIPSRARSISATWGPRIAEYYGRQARKYRRAAWLPWERIVPDPPAPGVSAGSG